MAQRRIMLVDDHEVVRIGMKALLERQTGYTVVAEASNEEEAVVRAQAHKPEIILMDVRMPNGSGITACERIMALLPKTRIIMLTSFADDELLFSAIRAGAVGYVLKQVGSHDLIKSIESAAQGNGTLDPTLTQRVFNELRRTIKKEESTAFNDLTDQEKRVLTLISQGETNKKIAETLFLSQGTVRNYVSTILSKLHVSNRAEAAAYAIEHHLHEQFDS